MEKYLVIGDPIGHSRSPAMQNAAFAAAGLGRPYGKKIVRSAELADFFEYARKNLCGVNVTVPHKLAAAQLVDVLTDRAERCGSVNTLIIRDGVITGDSTDGVGLEEALKYNFSCDLVGKQIVFCGAGGAARATAVHLAGCGVRGISFINRTLFKAEEISDICRKYHPNVSCECVAADDAVGCRRLLETGDLLIQATSLGLKDDDPPPLDESFFHPKMKLCVFDTIYRRTALQQIAKRNGIACADGMEMLVRQGAESFEKWTGIKPDLDAMRRGFAEGV